MRIGAGGEEAGKQFFVSPCGTKLGEKTSRACICRKKAVILQRERVPYLSNEYTTNIPPSEDPPRAGGRVVHRQRLPYSFADHGKHLYQRH